MTKDAFDASVQPSPIVETSGGPVRGFVDPQGVLTFRGIPYAADTSGTNRFLPPQPRPCWDEVRDATQWADPCPIAVAPASDVGVSEDCLVVNVWTRNVSGKMPVIVYLHGGAWRAAMGNQPERVPAVERCGVVFVRLQHRLGPLGYLALGEEFGPDYRQSANVGMLDIRAALLWVRDNIANFGGDPDNITIMGESGGGAKVLHALAMPSFKGLFHRAVILGGHDLWKRNDLASARKATAAVIAQLDVAPGDIKALQAMPLARLLEAHNTVIAATDPDPAWGGGPWICYDLLSPAIDGETLPEFPIDAIAHGASSDIPIMLGTTKMEHWLATAPSPNNATFFFQQDPDWGWQTREEVVGHLQPYLGERTELIVSAYESAMTGASPSSILHRIVTDRDWHLSHLEVAQAQAAANGQPAYLYFLDVESISSINQFNELPSGLAGAAAGQFTMACVAFATTGDPNHSVMNMPPWHPYALEAPAIMVFGSQTRLVEGAGEDIHVPLATLGIWRDGRD